MTEKKPLAIVEKHIDENFKDLDVDKILKDMLDRVINDLNAYCDSDIRYKPPKNR